MSDLFTPDDLAAAAPKLAMYGPLTHDVATNGDIRERAPWLIDAADLLAEPDPGPTPWLIQDLIVDQAIVAAVGRWKTTKSYGLLDLCVSIATGEPAFGTLEVPAPGPVIFVNEESGRNALWRRLDALCRGRAINPDRLRGQLLVAANARVRLDDTAWQDELLQLAHLEPRLIVFDPLARMKDPAREENEQSAMAVLLEFVRRLRDHARAAVCFVHHTGHTGDHMRGSSDLETVWETRLRWKRDGQSPLVTVESEHREAEAADPIEYRIAWDTPTRTMRFDIVSQPQDGLPSLEERIIEWLVDNQNQKADEIGKGLQVRVSDVRRTLDEMVDAQTVSRGPSGKRDSLGRPVKDTVYNSHCASAQPSLTTTPGPTHRASAQHPADPQPASSETRMVEPTVPRPTAGPNQADPEPMHRGAVPRPTTSSRAGTAEPPDEPPFDGHYLDEYIELPEEENA